MNILQSMEPSEFENAMERSLVLFLQSNIPSIEIYGDGATASYPVTVTNDGLYEGFIKDRENNAIINISSKEVNTEGFLLGRNLDYDIDSKICREKLWRYHNEYIFDVFTGSSTVRNKIDGKIRTILHDTRVGLGIPVYNFENDVTLATSIDTGCKITFPYMGEQKTIHSEDLDNNDYLSHWAVESRCLYAIDTLVEPVSAINVTASVE